ncbi:antibiotic biosynthesis monooxygenase family protein [Pseudomonas fluorescens]|uniref:antibiotic biosynthesis monooxygenase family protein n=1 Tax=Pseudomonas fluorescens TaxID=294 RepID=UPI003C1D831D
MRKVLLMSGFLTLVGITAMAHARDSSPIIEVVTATLKPEVSPKQFSVIDKQVEVQHVAKQPGFLSRESASTQDGQWVVIVHWRSVQDADASMKLFKQAPAAQAWMFSIDQSSMSMKRYTAP